jgi:hypothetical protein
MSSLLRTCPLAFTVAAPPIPEAAVKPLTALVLFFLLLFVGCAIQFPLEPFANMAGLAALGTGFVIFLVRFAQEITTSHRVDHWRVSRGTVRRLERGELLVAGGSHIETKINRKARIS